MNQQGPPESAGEPATTPMANSHRQVNITRDQLPIHCPLPESPLWNSHPRVYIPLAEAGRATCPYCGTEFVLVDTKAGD